MSRDEPKGSGRPLSSRALAAEEADHPSPEHLEAFHWGDVELAGADRLRLHLALCVDCREQLRLLDEMDGNLAHPSSQAPSGEAERAFARFQSTQGSAGPFPRWSSARGPYAIAASLLVAVLGLSFAFTAKLAREEARLRQSEQELGASKARLEASSRDLDREIAALRKEREELLAPQPNTPILDLHLDRGRGFEGALAAELPIGGSSRLVTLVLEDPGNRRGSSLRALFSDSADRPLFAVEGLRPSSYGNFVVTLDQTALPLGTTRVRLEARREGAWVAVARYSLRRKG